MNLRITIALVVLFVVVVLGGILLAWPAPQQNNGTPPPPPVAQPFTSENVKVSSPLPGSSLPKTFTVVGEARGTWYFEASFPVQVRDLANNLIAQTHAEAKSDWMTTDWVPFSSTVTVSNYSGPATLILMKDNPSGLPEFEDSVEFGVVIQ